LTRISLQKQKIAQPDSNEQNSESPLFSGDFSLSQASLDTSASTLSQLSVDNDVLVHDLNGIEKWLAKGKKQMAKLFGLSSSDKTMQRGPYKKKGTVQSIQAQQHNKKKHQDWTAKMWNGGFGDLHVLFGPKQQTPALREVLKIDSDSDEGSMVLDTMDGKEDDIPMVTPVDGPE
jgi:hypothetical protein